jgi:outer membrane lipoprotein-sorting protein
MRMNKLTAIFVSVIIACSAKAQHAGYTAVKDTAVFKQQFTTASQKISSCQSDFVQEKNLSMLSEKIVSKGKFWFKKDNKVRMEYNQPFQYLMILNNNNIYIKDGQKENKMSASSNKLFQQINRIVIDCVKGSAFSNTDFRINVFENKQTYLIELSPVVKNLKDIFKTINVTVDKKDYSVLSIQMNEVSGDYTSINFINKQINASLPDALFTAH